MPPVRILRWLILGILLLPLTSAAQQLPGAGAFDSGPGAEGHGWLVVGPDTSPVLVHIPPRGSVDVGGGRRISTQSGAVRVAASLNEMPEAIAAKGRAVYLVFPRSGSRRLVLRASVSPSPVGNLWDLDQRERLDAMPPLEAPGTLVSLAAGDAGLMALFSEGRPKRMLLLKMASEGWEPVELPAPAAAGRLVSSPGSIGLIAEGESGQAMLWNARAGSTKRPGPFEWQPADPPLLSAARVPDSGTLWSMGGGIVFGVRTPGGLDLRELRASGMYTIASIPSVASRFAMAPLPSSGRVVLVWKPSDLASPEAGKTAKGPAPDNNYSVLEVSIHSGRTLYAGPPSEAWPFSLLEFRLLALLLVAIVVGVLLFVLRPDAGDGTVLLPRGTALAEPWRRAIAGSIDLTVAWLIVSPLMGVTLESLAYPVFGARLVPTILLLLAVACGHCTIGEWMGGRSIGKLITGCRVARVGGSGDAGPGQQPPVAPSFREALIRNVIRWGVPPLGIAALATLEGRHRGDVAARTAVVVMLDTDEEPS